MYHLFFPFNTEPFYAYRRCRSLVNMIPVFLAQPALPGRYHHPYVRAPAWVWSLLRLSIRIHSHVRGVRDVRDVRPNGFWLVHGEISKG